MYRRGGCGTDCDVRGEPIDPIRRHEGGGRARVLEEVARQIGRRVGVHHHDDRAATQDPEQRGDEIDAVGKRDNHALLGAYVVCGEQRRVLRRTSRHIVVRERAGSGADRRTIAAPLRNPRVEQMLRKVEPDGNHTITISVKLSPIGCQLSALSYRHQDHVRGSQADIRQPRADG